MSNLTQENIWWPDCTVNVTTVVDAGYAVCPHEYSMRQTAQAVYMYCNRCPKQLRRLKYPNENHRK